MGIPAWPFVFLCAKVMITQTPQYALKGMSQMATPLLASGHRGGSTMLPKIMPPISGTKKTLSTLSLNKNIVLT